MKTPISGREFDTILAALNEWKNTGFRLTTLSAKQYLNRNGAPLSPTEVEILMDRLIGTEESPQLEEEAAVE